MGWCKGTFNVFLDLLNPNNQFKNLKEMLVFFFVILRKPLWLLLLSKLGRDHGGVHVTLMNTL